jgi:hypothetical protein
MNNVLEIGEKVHIIERRYFENDPRRHLVGEILKSMGNIIRVKGYVFVLDRGSNQFIKKQGLRDRVLTLGERLTINVIPQEVNLDDVEYIDEGKDGLVVTDGKSFSLDINEFSASR